MIKKSKTIEKYDIICVGGGIMSGTLALMLKLLDPTLKIAIVERAKKVATESSGSLNNAGTGHSALCELNYTPQLKDGSIHVTKALKIFEQFEQSKQFWAYLVKEKLISDPAVFVHPMPHHSWVTGKDDISYLKKRYEALQKYFIFQEMEYTEDVSTMEKWFPLIANNRTKTEKMAATRMEAGTEMNFETLTEAYFHILKEKFELDVITEHQVIDVDINRKKGWTVKAKDLKTNKRRYFDVPRLFIGAGGGAIPLLQKVDIKEKDGYGGFPISGKWLLCKNPEIIKQHNAKVYGKAGVNAPPMSVPHLDTRFINGEKKLLFGPFAGFSTKFLKQGSYLDLPKSIQKNNVPSMWGVFWHNIPLTKYLLKQVSMTHKDRIKELRAFIKDARSEDWVEQKAGQRVQIIKRDKERGAVLEFGTDIVHDPSGKITALLGASPGASVAVSVIVDVLKITFPKKIETAEWKEKLSIMIPLWDKELLKEKEFFLKLKEENDTILKLKNHSV